MRVASLRPNAGWARFCPSLSVLVALAALARVAGIPREMLSDPDTYLHIAAGRWILAHGALPFSDPFSHSLPGALWLPSEWLGEVALALAYDAGGWGAVVALTALGFALAIGLLTHFLLRRLDPLPALIAAVAAAGLLLAHLVARPHILALPCLVLWSGGLLRARDEGRDPPLALLPVMVLWANLHGSFMFGLALAIGLGGEAVLFPDGSRRTAALRWGRFVALALAASLATPNGIGGWLQPFRLLAMPTLTSTFDEWLSPNFQHPQMLEWWLLGVIGAGFAVGIKLPLTRVVLLLGLIHMALLHARHGDLLAVTGSLAIAAPFGNACRRLSGAAASGLTRGLASLARPRPLSRQGPALAVAVLLLLPIVLRPIDRPNGPITPKSALAAARALGITGNVFNAEKFGGYLIFRGVPTLIDGRIEMYGDDFLAREEKAELGDRTALTGLLDQYHVTWTLFPPGAGAVATLDRLSGWHRIYADKVAVIHVRDGTAH